MKRSNNSTVQNLDEIKRRKLNDEDCINTNYFLTCFENLSNDMLYEIFEYLDCFHIYQIFFNLNRRFQNLLTDFNLPLKINITSLSKSVFQHYYTDIINPQKHKISLLHITNHLSYNLDISPHHILSEFNRLETLILENITSKYLPIILNDISTLPKLYSLVIIPIDCVENINEIFLQIFRLSKLKYCKISFTNNHRRYTTLPYATSEHSSIEQLIIKYDIHVDNLHQLLSYIPKLRHLSIDYIYGNYISKSDYRIMLNHFKYLFLGIEHFQFDDLESLLKNFFTSIEVLHLSIKNRVDYLDSQRWEQLISTSIPSLRIFNIHCTYRYVRDRQAQCEHDARLNQFTELFWSKRQWFFTYRIYRKYGFHYIIFDSTNPYRRKDYKFEHESDQCGYKMNRIINLTSVHHIHIFDEKALFNCLNRFPNVTDLSLTNISLQKTETFIDNLKDIISFKNLTTLILENEDYSFKKLLELLLLTPNIHTLKIPFIQLNQKECLAIQNNEFFQSVAQVNKIRNLTIKQIFEIEKVELLFRLCSRLEQFTIEQRWNHVNQLIRFLLSKSNDYTHHLFYLCFSNDNKRLPNKLDTLIQGGKLLNDYYIKSEYPKIYLWW